jgi:hypothetical protein
MNIGLEQVEMHLEAGQIVRLYDSAGTRLECVRGALWITQHKDRNDHVLAAGHTLTLDRPGLALIHAQAPSEFLVHEPAPQISLRTRIVSALAAALCATGRWIARRFGPEAVTHHQLRGWHGAL